MNTLAQYDPLLFEGTAWYYARYRPAYPRELFAQLGNCYQLDGTGQALDLGCGTGQLGIPLAFLFEQVICMDPDRAMLAEAQRVATTSGVTNIRFVLGSSWGIDVGMGPFRLITMGESFHWMDRDKVLQTLYEMVVPAGGVAILSRRYHSPQGYQEVVDKVIKQYLGERRRAGQGFYSHPEERHEAILSRSRFQVMQPWNYEYQQDWTIEQITGYLYSTSYASRRLLGTQAGAFEQALRRQLLEVQVGGTFRFRIVVTALLAAKR